MRSVSIRLAVLLRVQPLVRHVQRVARVARFLGEQNGAERAADLEADSTFRERCARLVDQGLGLAFDQGHDQAELVAAEPVRTVHRCRDGRELRAETGEEGVTCRVAERVVVPLEPVEVEDHQQGGLDFRRREEAFEVGQELPTIAEAGQRVGDGLMPRELEQAAIFAEGHREPHDDRQQSRGRESHGEQVDLVEVVVDQDADGENGAGGRDCEERLALQFGSAPVYRPCGRSDQ